MDKNKIDLITEIANKKKKLDEVTSLLNSNKIKIEPNIYYLGTVINFGGNSSTNQTQVETARYLQPALIAWLNQEKNSLEKDLEELLS